MINIRDDLEMLGPVPPHFEKQFAALLVLVVVVVAIPATFLPPRPVTRLLENAHLQLVVFEALQ